MALVDLTGTKWQISHNFSVSINQKMYLLQGTVESEEIETAEHFTFSMERMMIANGSTKVVGFGQPDSSESGLMPPNITCAQGYDTWGYMPTVGVNISATAPIVTITGGDDATNSVVIAWFEANATKIVDPPKGKKFIDLDAGLTTIRDWVKSKLTKKAELSVASISTAGGGDEVHATISQETDAVNINYYKDGPTLPDYVNLSVDGDEFSFPTSRYVDDRIADVVNAAPFLATYEQTTYAEVTAAVDADRAIVVNFANNRNLICVTYATYTVGQNVTMSGIYKYGSGVSLAEITLTPENVWSIAHTWMQDRLVSGTNIKTVNNQSLLGSGNLDIGGGTVDAAMSDTSENAVQNKVIKSYVDGATGDLSTLTTDNKTTLVLAINEVYEKSGEPFRVKNWASNAINVEIPYCTEDIVNTGIPKMEFSISGTEGENYQIVGMIAYEVFDAASGGTRINCWPVCQFTGNGQKTLTVRWMCGGTTRKTAKRINAWVLLKHR